MKTTSQGSRDELDLLIARQVRVQRPLAVVQTLPAAAADEPTDDELLQAVEGRLEAAAQAALEQRLEQYPFTRDRLRILREALEEAAEAAPGQADIGQADIGQAETGQANSAGPLTRLVFALRRGGQRALDFVRGTDQPLTLQPNALATRSGVIGAHGSSSADASPFYKFARRFGSCDAMIHVERVPGRGVDLRLELSTSGEPVTDGRASLRRQGRLIESVRIRRGQADFSGLQVSASYEMEIKREGELVGEVCLSFLTA